ncbi:MAG: RnfABCDGE type electron transport complex subunit D [Prolixibacteraceae bacterium]|nr:RnfABCDGE type electron transport complex subunit D [Prolixibacteraceae bacterium]
MNNLLKISPSPHVQTRDSVRKIMYRVILALLPALIWSVVVFGFGALLLTVISVAACVCAEYLIQRFILKTEPSISDGSAIITGILLAFNVPSNLPWWIMVIGAIVAIGVGKMSFGGLGTNIFNPALVGRVFLLISFPVQMTTWPVSRLCDADTATTATPLALFKGAAKSGNAVSELPDSIDLLFGNMPGSLGEISALLLIIGGLYLLVRKVITWQTPVSMLGTIFIFAVIFHYINPEIYVLPVYHLLTGGAILGAFFMATDMVTSPMSGKGQIIFGIGIGVITMCIRLFGAYPEGVSFAILIMNAFTPLINKGLKPGRFGGKK